MRAHTCRCACGHDTTAAFPAEVRSPVSYGPRVRAVVAYLLGRQHVPTRRVAESMADLFGVGISTGAVDSIYAEASRRLRGFIATLVALLRSLPVLHADETSDRVGTRNCWMHVVSTGLYTLIHASATRGGDAIDEAGVLRGYRGVMVHDRLAMYWKLKAKPGVCVAHLPRDLADVATWVTQTAWAAGSPACSWRSTRPATTPVGAASRRWHRRSSGPSPPRYDALVADGVAANTAPASGRKRNYVEGRSFNLVTAFATHRKAMLRYMYDLDVSWTNNQAERDLRPTKNAPQDLRLLPQPRRRRALRPPTQLPVDHPQERRPRHRRPHPSVQPRPVDAARSG